MATPRPKQHLLFKKQKSDFGGILRNTRKGRQGARPLADRKSMHLVLRSSKAKGVWSFKAPKNKRRIDQIIQKFGSKYGVRILHFANVGNHLHMHLQLRSRHTYKAFIRALTGAIAQAVTKASRVNPLKAAFWDYRPFTRIVQGLRDKLGLRHYITVNQFEGFGYSRGEAQMAAESVRSRWRPVG